MNRRGFIKALGVTAAAAVGIKAAIQAKTGMLEGSWREWFGMRWTNNEPMTATEVLKGQHKFYAGPQYVEPSLNDYFVRSYDAKIQRVLVEVAAEERVVDPPLLVKIGRFSDFV